MAFTGTAYSNLFKVIQTCLNMAGVAKEPPGTGTTD